MGAPPRDSDGRVVPHDDPDIAENAYVLRNIVPEWLTAHPTLPAQRRLSSAAFSPSSKPRDPYQGMSVDLLQPMLDAGLPATGGKGAKHEAVVRLRVGELRRLGLQVGQDPRDANPFHAAVWGIKKGMKSKILNLCEWVDKPDDVIT